MFKLKKIIMIPTTYVKTLEYLSMVDPNNVAVAPNDTNTRKTNCKNEFL